MSKPLKLGISSCLLGENVRYNGGHCLDRYLRDTLGQFVEYVPVCPEVEAGFGIPRETLRLEGSPADPRLMTTKTGIDRTDTMKSWCAERVRQLEKENLCGFIFRKNSPSSGWKRVKVYSAKGMPARSGMGLFARAFTDHFPLLPVEEDGRLNDEHLRENFIERIFACRRWQEMLADHKTRGGLVSFHTKSKLLILAHSPKHYKAMGGLVAHLKGRSLKNVLDEYFALLMEAMQLKATCRKHVNILQHIMGYFKKDLSPDEKQELLAIIDQYRKQYLPLIVPVTLLNHYVRKYNNEYLSQQYYLNPHPMELKLRNHA